MGSAEIDTALEAAEAALARGEGLAGTGFWKAVAAIKRSPELVDAYADRVAAIDQRAFSGWALIKVSMAVGTALMAIGTVAGLGLVWWAYSLEQPWNGLVLLAGTGITLVTTHGLAHLVVGRIFGIEYTGWFVGTVTRPQPGVKIDYASYLRTPARQRAWMHAAGAVVTKLIPFFALPPAFVMDAPSWTVAVLVVLGAGQILTDVVWSTKSSDWKKYRREMGYASPSSG